MMLHQDGSRHQWVAGKYWDLIVTMDDATSEHYSMFFVEEEGTQSSFQGVKEVIEQHDGVWERMTIILSNPYEGYVTRDSFLNHILVPENISYPRITVQKDKIL